MGRFLTIALLLTGCGRYGFDDMAAPPGAGEPGTTDPYPTNTTTPLPNAMVQVCAVSNTTTPLVADDAQNIAVTATPAGATVFSTAETGGPLVGLNLDASFTALGSPVQVVAGSYTNASTSYVDGKLIAAAMNNSRVLVNIVQPDLGGYNQIGNLDGLYVAKDALLDANGDRITPTSCSAGLTVNPWDASWAPQTSQLAVTTNQSTGIASTPFGADAMVFWSTADECHMERVTSFANGAGAMQSYACTSPRIAADVTASTGTLVFEASDGVRVSTFTNSAISAGSTLVAAGATSPRVAFDGAQYWVAYINATGTVDVGFIDATDTLQTTATDIAPTHDAFELVIIGGKIWVVAGDHAGVAARQICYQR